MIKHNMSGLSPRRQESHRVYLQQFTRGGTATVPQHESSVNTTSAAVRLTLESTTEKFTELLRQKFGLLPLPKIPGASATRSTSSSALDRINAHLAMQRQKSSENENNKRRKRAYDPYKDDTLVIVASCFLPRGYVRFEHEQPTASASHNSTSNANHSLSQPQNSSGSEAFNLFKTLSPDDNPLFVKDELYQKILLIQEEAIALFGSSSAGSGPGSSADDITAATSKSPRRVRKPPVIRLFFMPCHNSGVSNATIEMEGYCTDTEEENDNDVDNDEDTEMNELSSNATTPIPQWKRDMIPYSSHPKVEISKQQKGLMKERRLLTILSGHEIASGNECVSGYLLKQSKLDGNVWKRVHCVLPNYPQFWFVSRVEKDGHMFPQEDLPGNNMITSQCLGKHGMIELIGTFLIETIDTDSPLSGIPCTFQLMTKDGDIHTFRANSKSAYSRWMDCLSNRIVECQENSYLDHAEALVRIALVGRDIK